MPENSTDRFKAFVEEKGLLIILLLSGAVFINTLYSDFVWDDWTLIVYNKVYRSFDLRAMFVSMGNSLEYLPVRDLTLAFDMLIWGPRPFGFHLTNLVIYLAGLVVLYRAVNRTCTWYGFQKTGYIAFWAVLIFSIHPLHSEPVSFIAARNNLLAGLFLFLSLDLLLKGLETGKGKYLVLSSGAFVFALFSKASVVFFPLFVGFLLMTSAKESRFKKHFTLIFILFLIIDIAAVALHYSIAVSSALVNKSMFRFGAKNAGVLLMKALEIPLFYLKKLFVPFPLSINYPETFGAGGGHHILTISIVYGVILSVLVLAWRRKHWLIVSGLVWSFLSLGPVLNIFPTSPVVADRYAYFAVLGFSLVFAYCADRISTRKTLFLFVIAAYVCALSVLTVRRNAEWKSEVTLWESAFKLNPDTDRSNLAASFWNRGKYEEALKLLREERDLTGSFNYFLYRGRYEYLQGKYSDALNYYEKAIAEGAGALKETHVFIAEAYEKEGALLQASRFYQRALDTASTDPLGENTEKARLGLERIRTQLSEELNRLIRKAETNPDNYEVKKELGVFYYELGMYSESESVLLDVMAHRPSWDLYYNLGNVYIRKEEYEKAVAVFRKALAISPENTDVLRNIAIACLKMNDTDKAIEYFEQIYRIDPKNLHAVFNLGKIYYNTGDRVNAKKYLTVAKELAQGNGALQRKIDQLLETLL